MMQLFADNLPQINLQGEYDFLKHIQFFKWNFYTKKKTVGYSGASLKQKIWDFKKLLLN